MKAIIVDDNEPFAREVERALGFSLILLFPETRATTHEVAEEIAGNVGEGEKSIVLINVNLKWGKSYRQDQAGVDVLKQLRLTRKFKGGENKARDVHCVLYSFQSLKQLLGARPDNVLLCSEGVSYVRLPHVFTEEYLSDLAARKARTERLADFIRGGFTLPDARHDWANWWAARKMAMISAYESRRYDVNISDFALDDPQVRNALFLFDQEDKFVVLMNEERRRQIGTIRSTIRRHLDPGRNRSSKVGIIDDEAEQCGGEARFGWRQVYSNALFKRDNRVVNLIGELTPDSERIDIEQVVAAIKETEPDGTSKLEEYACLLLDLRLLSEQSGSLAVQDLSGANVLEAIRKAEPTLPVIMTTASNKISSYEELTRLGADAYWIKQDRRETDCPGDARSLRQIS